MQKRKLDVYKVKEGKFLSFEKSIELESFSQVDVLRTESRYTLLGHCYGGSSCAKDISLMTLGLDLEKVQSTHFKVPDLQTVSSLNMGPDAKEAFITYSDEKNFKLAVLNLEKGHDRDHYRPLSLT